VIGLATAETALHFLFGPDFEAATRPLRVLLLALPANLAAGHYRAALIALGRQQLDLRLVAACALVHIGAKLCLIPAFGMSGAACGTVAGEAALMLLSWRVVRTLLGKPAVVWCGPEHSPRIAELSAIMGALE
jgi:O-antigen/teichoic acid export membrane protein